MLSRDRLLAGVDEYDGAVDSAINVLGDEGVEEGDEFEGEIMVLKPLLLFDLDGLFEYEGCVTNFGCECDRRSELEEK